VPGYSIPRNKQDSSSTSGGLRMTVIFYVTLSEAKGLSIQNNITLIDAAKY